MTAPVPPPPPAPGTTVRQPAPGEPVFLPDVRPGQLVGWASLAHLIVWATGAVGLALVAYSSSRTGFGLWWVAPPGSARTRLFVFLPFLVPIAMIIGTLGRWRFLPWLGIAGAALMAGSGAIDLGWSKGYALVELTLAASQLLVSALTLGGVYRAAR